MATKPMKKPPQPAPTECQLQIEEAMAEFRDALAVAESHKAATDEERDRFETKVCLGCRSAYFDFFTWLALHGEVDKPAERELEGLFRRAFAVMRENSRYLKSVRDRYDDFRSECKRVGEASYSHLGKSSRLLLTTDAAQ
jgi:hypothetical protein